MNKKNEQDVLIVRDEKTGEVSVVAELNADGTPKRVAAKAEHRQDFLRFDRNSDAIDSFFHNFYRQCKEPTRFGFYRIAAEQAEQLLGVMKELLKDPVKNAELLAAHKIDMSAYADEVKSVERREKNPNADEAAADAVSINNSNKTEMKENVQGQEATAQVKDKQDTAQTTNQQGADGEQKTLIDANAVDWQDVKTKYGVDFGAMSEGDRQALLNYGKTGLVTVKPTLGGETIEIQARLSFKKDADGSLKLVPHFVRNEPRLDVAYKGYSFTDEDRKSLRQTGNLGKVVNLPNASGEPTPSYVSIDRLTKEITDVHTSKVRIPERIGKTVITPDDKKILLAGLPLRKEIELTDGRKFSPLLQINVEQRGVEFVPNSVQRQGKVKSEERRVKNTDADGQKESKGQKQRDENHWLNADGSIRKLATYFKQPLTEQQQNDYAAGKTIEIRNVPEKNGSGTYTAYVKFDMDAKRAYRENPDLSQAVSQTPTDGNKTQVAVNEQGKTNEATKKVTEPLKPGQVAPKNEKQSTEQKATAKRAKGMKV